MARLTTCAPGPDATPCPLRTDFCSLACQYFKVIPLKRGLRKFCELTGERLFIVTPAGSVAPLSLTGMEGV